MPHWSVDSTCTVQHDSGNATVRGTGSDGSTSLQAKEDGMVESSLVCLPLLMKNSGRNPVTAHPASDIVLAMVPINPDIPPPYIRLILRLARQSPRAVSTKKLHHNDTAPVFNMPGSSIQGRKLRLV